MIRALALRAALAAVLAVAASPAARAQDLPRRTSGARAVDPSLRLGGLLGLEFGAGDTGLALRVDGEMPIQAVGSGATLSGVLSLGYSRLEDEGRNFDWTTNVVKVVPALRLTFGELAPQFGLYGDAGLGFFYQSTNWRDRRSGAPDQDDSGVGLALRFAGGALFDVSDRLRLGGELGVNPYFGGDLGETTVTLLAALTYRL
jgi:hypothetical protein